MSTQHPGTWEFTKLSFELRNAGFSLGEYGWGSAPLAPKNFLGGVAFLMGVVIFVYNVLIDLNEISESY